MAKPKRPDVDPWGSFYHLLWYLSVGHPEAVNEARRLADVIEKQAAWPARERVQLALNSIAQWEVP